ncbi:MAG: hypothetical protein ACI4PE_03855 [Bacilli bacterium]
METITVYKETKKIEKFELDIEDVKNCYLKGNDNFNNIPNYLGIWTDKVGLKVIEIRNQRMVGLEVSSNKSVYTYVDIERFLKNNNNVQVISKESFRKELNRIIDILKEVE